MNRRVKYRERAILRNETLESRQLLAGDLVAQWLAHDLIDSHSQGDTVEAWTDRIGQAEAAKTVIGNPTFSTAAVGGRAAISFDASDGTDVLTVARDANPMKGAEDFTVSVVFATSATTLQGDGEDWFSNSALVDGSQRGFSTGWGLTINDAGNAFAGVSDGFGRPNTTVKSTVAGLNDGQTHTLFYTKSGSDLSLYVDDQPAATVGNASAQARSSTLGMSIGGLFSGGGEFTGDIAEVRIYDGALTSGEITTVRDELTAFYNNSAPVAVDDTYTVEEDKPLGLIVSAATGVLNNDSDVDGDPLTAQLVEDTDDGRLSLRADGSFFFIPDKNFSGAATFTYSAVDFRPSNVATVTINVTPSYDPVVTQSDSYKARPTETLNIPALVGLLANDSNPDNIDRKVVLASDVGNGVLDLKQDGSFSYDAQGFAGVTSFTYQVDDGTNVSNPETVELTVNTVPVANNDTLEVDEDQVLTLNGDAISANDVDADGNALTFSLIDTTTHGELTLGENGAIVYTPNPDFFGQDEFTYQLSDGVDPSNVATVTLNVLPVNDAPVVVPDAYFGKVSEAIEIAANKGVLANDSDIDSANLTATLVEGPANGQVTLNADGSLNYQPNEGYKGTDSFTYRTSDGSLSSEPAEVQLFVGGTPVRISEILVANATEIETRLREEPGDRFRGDRLSPDWIEIENLSSSEFDLSGYFLTDDRFDGQKWQIPDGFVLPAAGYGVFYASQRNVTNTELDETQTMHTNFGLSIDGEYVGISDPDGNTIFDFSFPQQYPDVSYGFTPDGELDYLVEPTRAADNVGAFAGIVKDTNFSVDRGIYSEPFEVEITTNSEGAEIRYTLDGSIPSPENGSVYTSPILIDGTTTLRAGAFLDGYLTPNVDTQTYIFLDQVIGQTGAPEVGPSHTRISFPERWGGQRADYEMDAGVTNDPAYKDQIHEALTSLPSLSLTAPPEAMFERTGLYARPGATGEEAASAELIFPDGSVGFQIDAGARMQGGASRNAEHLKHSMSLRFREDYGHSDLDYALFEGSPVSQFNSIHLRARYNNSWIHWDQGQRNRGSMMREMWMRETMLAAGQEAAGHGRYVHLYLNGLYWGVYEMHERQDASHYASYFGGDSLDYAATNGGAVIDGASDSWSNLSSVVRSGDWEQVQETLDIDNHILYTIIQRFGGNQDLKSAGNWRSAGGGTANAPWQFYVWDAERVLENPRQRGTSPEPDLLRIVRTFDENDEYRIRFADHIHRLLFNNGALTPDQTADRWLTIAAQLDTAIIAESARWGDARPDRGQRRALTKNEDWLPEQQRLLEDYFPVRTENVLGQFVRDNLYPETSAPEFLVNNNRQHGGSLNPDDQLTVQNPGNVGIIYYTTDGSDPRVEGGAVSDAAMVYANGISLENTALVRMRILNDQEWSALSEATFITERVADGTNLRISEINYHPHASLTDFGEPDQADNNFEFIELMNVSNDRVNLTGVEFRPVNIEGNAEGVNFVFGTQILEPQQRTVVVRNRAAFEARYGDTVTIAAGNDGIGGIEGQWSGGRLSDGGETIALFRQDEEILRVTYNDAGTWPDRADGIGSTLELVDSSDPNSGTSWKASTRIGGTPGYSEDTTFSVVINEVLSNSEAPAVDQVELLNTGSNAVDVSNWYLSDSSRNLTKHRIAADSTIDPNGYWTIDQSVFGFGFNGQSNDDIWLTTSDETGKPSHFVDSAQFNAAEEGASFGRWPDGEGRLFPMTQNTFGAANSGPVVPTIFISEIHYNPEPRLPEDLSQNDREFVEITNLNPATDLSGWRLDNAADFTFPAETMIGSGESILVVSFDPSEAEKTNAFRSFYNLDANVAIFGPYSGVLDNGGERVELDRPVEGSDPILVDRVRYDDDAPWPIQADANGASLQRISNANFGDLASSWVATAPTPGVATIPDLLGDFDNNSVVNAVDIEHFCTQADRNDSVYDLDGDGSNGTHDDFLFLIRNILGTDLGDSDLDGQFTSRDLVQIFVAGEYEDGIADNSNWTEGDWNCDNEFDTSDLVAAFQAGSYVNNATVGSSQIAGSIATTSDHQLEGSTPNRSGWAEAADSPSNREVHLNREDVDLLFHDFESAEFASTDNSEMDDESFI